MSGIGLLKLLKQIDLGQIAKASISSYRLCIAVESRLISRVKCKDKEEEKYMLVISESPNYKNIW